MEAYKYKYMHVLTRVSDPGEGDPDPTLENKLDLDPEKLGKKPLIGAIKRS